MATWTKRIFNAKFEFFYVRNLRNHDALPNILAPQRATTTEVLHRIFDQWPWRFLSDQDAIVKNSLFLNNSKKLSSNLGSMENLRGHNLAYLHYTRKVWRSRSYVCFKKNVFFFQNLYAPNRRDCLDPVTGILVWLQLCTEFVYLILA